MEGLTARRLIGQVYSCVVDCIYHFQNQRAPFGCHIFSQTNPRPTIEIEGYKVLPRNLLESKLNDSICNEVRSPNVLHRMQKMKMNNIWELQMSSMCAIGTFGECCDLRDGSITCP